MCWGHVPHMRPVPCSGVDDATVAVAVAVAVAVTVTVTVVAAV